MGEVNHPWQAVTAGKLMNRVKVSDKDVPAYGLAKIYM